MTYQQHRRTETRTETVYRPRPYAPEPRNDPDGNGRGILIFVIVILCLMGGAAPIIGIGLLAGLVILIGSLLAAIVALAQWLWERGGEAMSAGAKRPPPPPPGGTAAIVPGDDGLGLGWLVLILVIGTLILMRIGVPPMFALGIAGAATVVVWLKWR